MFKNWQDRLLKDGKNHTISGNVKIMQYFNMPQLRRRRRVWIYLPPDYEQSNDRYPVLYMHDGQNLFDNATAHAGEWLIDKTVDYLVNSGKTRGAIIVAIDNGKRKRPSEYCPGWEGDKYGEFLVHTLKPFIDSKFRTLPGREHTGIAGSSLGGVISLYLGLKYQHVFSRIGAFSPAVFVGQADYAQYFSRFSDTRIYIDVGTQEVGAQSKNPSSEDYLRHVVDFYNGLRAIGYQEQQLKLLLDYGAVHSEAVWARRFPPAFMWLFDDATYWHELHLRSFSRWSVTQQYYMPPVVMAEAANTNDFDKTTSDKSKVTVKAAINFKRVFHEMNLMQTFDAQKIKAALCS